MTDQTEMVPLADALAELGITHPTLSRYCDRGYLRKVRSGSRVYVPRQAITDYWAMLDNEAAKRQRALARARGQSRRSSSPPPSPSTTRA